MITQTLLQLTSAVGVYRPGEDLQPHHVTSIQCIGAGVIAANFAIKYSYSGRADFLVGLMVFVVLTVRTLLIFGFAKR